MSDEKQVDDKIIAVAKNDMSVNYINELPPHTQVELKRFFEDYKKLERNEVPVKDFPGKKKAYKIIEDSIRLYQENGEVLRSK